ncbi:hypothetical protein [Pedobacter sp. SL55]|uniref:hypothetical protein n=1 Tax=Pedobacter sp. SL55 TaxID=2995161 RepID=UPI0022702BFF|nr:hypothetical protein [Pedobacter sp. SL55]WAC40561.1 hypothetical protein OVA16_18650 [Pedobacter sp. SL55]
MENTNLKSKLAKIYELVKRGSTAGEQAAAKNQLDKLIEKYNLQGIDLENLNLNEYRFKYKTELDVWLLGRIVLVFTDGKAWDNAVKDVWKVREVELSLTYIDWVTIETAYQYFKKHMAQQWKIVCAGEIKRKRKASTRKKRLQELKEPFFSRYVIASKLYKDGELKPVTYSDMSDKEYQDRLLMEDIEGGSYKRQVTNGLYLEA